MLTVLNLHKPRDRTHFEQFGQFHRTFYRAVEATSVTPWAARALDRALAAIVVAAVRHVDGAMTPEDAVTELKNQVNLRGGTRRDCCARAPNSVAGGRAALSDANRRDPQCVDRTVDEQSQCGRVRLCAPK